MSNRVRSLLISVVAFVWAANFVAPIVIRGYEPPTEVHLVFMAVLGLLLGLRNSDEPAGPTSQRQSKLPTSSPPESEGATEAVRSHDIQQSRENH